MVKKHVVLDLETTGFGSSSQVLQISIIDSEGNVIIDKKIKPPEECFTDDKLIRMWEHSTEIHRITPNDVINCKPFTDVIEEIHNSIKDKEVLIYNKAFDMRYLNESLIDSASSFTCVMNAFTKWFGKKSKLSFAAKHCGFNFDEDKAHDSLYDCEATLYVWKHINNLNNNS